MGVIDLQSIQWYKLITTKQPQLNEVRDYNRFQHLTPFRDLYQKIFADQKRVCEVEDTVVEWFGIEHVKNESLKMHIRRNVDLNEFRK